MNQKLPAKPERQHIRPAIFADTDKTVDAISWYHFEQWWMNEIEPLFANAVIVYGSFDDVNWLWAEDQESIDTHTAMLLGVTPIIKDNHARDLISSMLNYIQGDYPRMESTKHGNYSNELIRKARAYLEGKK